MENMVIILVVHYQEPYFRCDYAVVKIKYSNLTILIQALMLTIVT